LVYTKQRKNVSKNYYTPMNLEIQLSEIIAHDFKGSIPVSFPDGSLRRYPYDDFVSLLVENNYVLTFNPKNARTKIILSNARTNDYWM